MQTLTPPPAPAGFPPPAPKKNHALAITAIIVGGLVAVVVAVTALVLFKGDSKADATTNTTESVSTDEGMSAVEFQAWWAKEYPDDAQAECDDFSKQRDDGSTREQMVQDYVDFLNEPMTAQEEADNARETADWPAIDPAVTDRQMAEASVDYCFVGGA